LRKEVKNIKKNVVPVSFSNTANKVGHSKQDSLNGYIDEA